MPLPHFRYSLVTAFFGSLLIALPARAEPKRAPFGLEELKSSIELSKAVQVEEVVPILIRNLTSNFTVIHDSDSPQDGAVRNPRILFWDEYSGLTATFNGYAAQGESNTLEFMQFDRASSRFRLLRQTFPLAKSATGVPNFSPTEPQECKLCHGLDPRPIWSEYPNWPGVLGSDNDFIKSADEKRYADFTQGVLSHARYRGLFLQYPDASWLTFPYRSETGPQKEFNNSATLRPNMRVGQLMARLNTARVMRKIRATADYRKNLPVLLYGFLGCDGNGIQKTSAGLLALAGLDILDVDLRVSYVSDLSAELEAGPSYFDGSASINELIANELMKDAVREDPAYNDVYNPNTLRQKYRFPTHANDLDVPFNTQMDKLGQWIPTPYRPEEMETKHRQQFNAYFRKNWRETCDFVKNKGMPAQRLALAAAATIPGQAPSSLTLTKTPSAHATGQLPGQARNAFGYYEIYCAKCHTGPTGVELFVRNSGDLRAYRDMNGQSLLDKIRLGIMPKGLRSASKDYNAQWEQDKAKFINELEQGK